MGGTDVAKRAKSVCGRTQFKEKKLSIAPQKAGNSDSLSKSPSSSSVSVASSAWTTIAVLFRFLQYLFISVASHFWSTDGKGANADRKRRSRVSVSVGTCDVGTRACVGAEDAKLRKGQNTKSIGKPSTNVSLKVDAFSTVDLWLGRKDVAAQINGFSSADSGIGSRPVSSSDTNETSSECCTEEYTLPIRRSRFLEYNKNNYAPSEQADASGHMSRCAGLPKGSASYYPPRRRSVRHDLSITRHIVRVRSGRAKRAKSAAMVARVPKSGPETEPEASVSTFYEDYDQFY